MDGREAIYRNLHADQLTAEKAATEYSANAALSILFKFYKPTSVLDVGCGLGGWLKMAQRHDIEDVLGIEGPWIDQAVLEVDRGLVQTADLEIGFDLGRKFGLVISLEVGEHLSETSADGFVASLVRHGPVILFSAAIPLQGGEHHVNEQFLPYWVDKFAQHGYESLDIIRPRIWQDDNVLLWLRQNAVIFAESKFLAEQEALFVGSMLRGPLSLVHPEFYRRKMQQVAELEGLHAYISRGGLFRVRRDEYGRLAIDQVQSESVLGIVS